MIKRRILIFILVLLTLTGCKSEDNSNNITFSVLFNETQDYPYSEDWEILEEYRDEKNVTFDIKVGDNANFEDAIELNLTSESPPDVILKCWPEAIEGYANDGLLLAISDYEDLMPHFKAYIEQNNLQDEIDELRLDNGKYYILPGYQREIQVQQWIYRQDIFEENNIAIPTTYDELFESLVTLKEIYPDSTPMTASWGGAHLLSMMGAGHGIPAGWSGTRFFDEETNEWKYAPATEAEKTIEKINKKAKKIEIESIGLSISFGFATKNNINMDIQETFRSAEDSMYRVKLLEIPSMRSGAIETILNTLYEKDKNSEIHSRTVSKISEKIASSYGMNRQEISEVKTAGLLHDIGKIIIPIDIIIKEGKLTTKEYELIKTHPEIGFRILNSTHDMRSISNIVLNHHERWDGLGYPRGIKNEDIPLQSRIISIADAFDAMTSERTYREIFTNEEALKEIMNNAGTQFDPELAKVFEDHFKEITSE